MFLVYLVAIPAAGQSDDSGWQFIERPFNDAWLAITPTHDIYNAVCARGDPFEFYARPQGEATKLMVIFSGGGACWNALTCSETGATFVDTIGAQQPDRQWPGILDFDNPRNPVRDYQTVVVPYCTGDVFMGSRTVTYRSLFGAVTIEHQGFTLGAAVREWIYDRYPEVTDLLITGASAGAYGSIFHAPYFMAHYPDAHIVQFADSGVGVTPDAWDALENWGMFDNLPDFIPAAVEIEPETFTINVLYRMAAEYFPQHSFSQFTTDADDVQRLFYELSGGEPGTWSRDARIRLDALDQGLPNFYAYIAPGDAHTILVSPKFYTLQVEDVSLAEWLSGLLDGSLSKDLSGMVCDMCK